MDNTTAAIRDLITYLKQQEIRQIVGSDTAFYKFNDSQNTTRRRYLAALKSGEDQDFVDALQSSPYPYQFATESMNEEGEQK